MIHQFPVGADEVYEHSPHLFGREDDMDVAGVWDALIPQAGGVDGAPIGFDIFGEGIAEFEFSLVFADAPVAEYVRCRKNALTSDQKKGALLFFGKGRC